VSLPCTVLRNEALVQGKFTRRHRLSSGAVVNGERIRTSTTRNLDEDAVVTLGLCKSGVAGLVVLALCRRTPNQEPEKCKLQGGRCLGLVYVGLTGHRHTRQFLKLTRMRCAGDTEARRRDSSVRVGVRIRDESSQPASFHTRTPLSPPVADSRDRASVSPAQRVVVLFWPTRWQCLRLT
jgi:hypothetical protein